MESKETLNKAYKWAYAGRWIGKVFSVIVTFMLARQLETKDFGLIALALVYLSFIQIFLSTGFSAAIVQRKNLRDEHLHSVFWINVAFGLFLAGMSVVLAPWWSNANNSPLLYKIILILSATIPIQSLTLVQQSILQRRLDFKTLTIRSSVSVIAGGGTAIILAYLGHGVWALVVQHLVTPVVGLITLWSMTKWRPKLVFSMVAARELVRYSAGILSGALAVFATSRADTYLMGMLFSNAAIVGIYRLAESLMNVVLDFGTAALATVSFSQFSRAQGNPELLRTQYLSLLHLNAAVAIPSFCLLAALSDTLMEFLGQRWLPAADVLKVLCFVGILQSFATYSGPLLMAIGKPGLYALLLWIAAICSNAAFTGAGLFLQNSPDESKPLGISLTRLLLNLLIYFPLLLTPVLRHLGLPLKELVATLRTPLLAGAAASISAILISKTPIVSEWPAFLRLCLEGSAGGTVALTLLFVTDPASRRVLQSLFAMMPWRRRKTPSP